MKNLVLKGFLLAQLVCAEACMSGEPQEAQTIDSDQAALLAQIPPDQADNAVVGAWRPQAYEVGFAEHQFQSFKGARANAMMHLAMHDALNAVVPVYRQYSNVRRDKHADPVVAAAQAAHDVLIHEYPSAQATLDLELERWLSRQHDSRSKRRGVVLGQRSAAAILARRADDGYAQEAPYTFDPAPGHYRTTPPWDGFVLAPGFRFARPFALASPSQFRPGPPPELDSVEYASAFEEVKQFGRADSSVRTPDQTGYAVWWMEFTDGSVNRLARDLVTAKRVHLWRTARLFALLDMAEFDAFLAVWDSKYHF